MAKQSSKHTSESSEEDMLNQLFRDIEILRSLLADGETIDPEVNDVCKNIKHNMPLIILQFHEHKQTILSQYDPWLEPFILEITEDWLQMANSLAQGFEFLFSKPNHTLSERLQEHAAQWLKLHENLLNRNHLMERLLALISERARQFVDHDVKVITEYQSHTLQTLVDEVDELEEIKIRLIEATRDPLLRLLDLKHKAEAPLSLPLAAEWLAGFQKERESYFDQLLTRIDNVVSEQVGVKSVPCDAELANEAEAEFIFVEAELFQIANASEQPIISEKDRQFFLEQLQCLADHIKQFDCYILPNHLKKKFQGIKDKIALLGPRFLL